MNVHSSCFKIAESGVNAEELAAGHGHPSGASEEIRLPPSRFRPELVSRFCPSSLHTGMINGASENVAEDDLEAEKRGTLIIGMASESVEI